MKALPVGGAFFVGVFLFFDTKSHITILKNYIKVIKKYHLGNN